MRIFYQFTPLILYENNARRNGFLKRIKNVIRRCGGGRLGRRFYCADPGEH